MVKKVKILKTTNNFKKLKTNSVGLKSDNYTKNIPNIRHLTRIIMALKTIKEKINQTEIAEFSGIENGRLKGTLIWLMNNKILCRVCASHGNCRGKYYLNPKWLALENEEK